MDISNKFLALLLVAAVTISLGGTLISLNKLDKLTTTGYATSNQSGVATVNISSSGSINFNVNSMDFGAGSVNGSLNNCTMMSYNATEPWKSAGCLNFSATRPSDFVLENNGNKNVTVQLYSNANASSFIGGGAADVQPVFQYLVRDDETGSCVVGIAPSTYDDVNVTNPGTTICGDFTAANSADTMNISVKIIIPLDAPERNNVATFTAVGTYG